MHMNIHRLLFHNPPETHKQSIYVSAKKDNVENCNSKHTEEGYMIEELAVPGGPSNLHHAWCNDCHLVVPNTRIHAKRTADALKGWCIASCLKMQARKKYYIHLFFIYKYIF